MENMTTKITSTYNNEQDKKVEILLFLTTNNKEKELKF